MDMEKKYWLIKTGLIALILPLLIMGFNYFMDPLWCFNISHRYNQVQVEMELRAAIEGRRSIRKFKAKEISHPYVGQGLGVF